MKKRINLTVSEELYSAIKEKSTRIGIPMSTYIQVIIANSLDYERQILSNSNLLGVMNDNQEDNK